MKPILLRYISLLLALCLAADSPAQATILFRTSTPRPSHLLATQSPFEQQALSARLFTAHRDLNSFLQPRHGMALLALGAATQLPGLTSYLPHLTHFLGQFLPHAGSNPWLTYGSTHGVLGWGLLSGVIVGMVANGGKPPEPNGEPAINHPLVQAAARAAVAISLQHPEGNQPHRTGIVTQKFLENMTALNLEPDPLILAASYLAGVEESELLKVRNMTDSEKKFLWGVIHRVNAAYEKPFEVPDNLYELEPNALTNLMGQYAKSVQSVDELILVIARTQAAMENPAIPSDIKSKLGNKMNLVFGYMVNRLGGRVLDEKLRNDGLQAAKPIRFKRLERVRSLKLEMTLDQADTYGAATARKIELLLRRSGIPAHIQGGKTKRVAAMQRKFIARQREARKSGHPKRLRDNEEYKRFQDFEDILRFRIVLEKPEDLGYILEVMGRFEDFTGEFTKRGAPEATKLRGYDAWNVTFKGEVNGKIQNHEFQIFMSPEEYHHYEYGSPTSTSARRRKAAWWSYALYQETGHFPPEDEYFEVQENDLRGNFLRYQNAIAPFTYFYMARHQQGLEYLIPSRIPSGKGIGNLADALAVTRQLTPDTVGASIYRRAFNATAQPGGLWKRTRSTSKSLDYIVQEGDVLDPLVGNVETRSELAFRDLERSCSTLASLVLLHDFHRKDSGSLMMAGEKKLVDLIRTTLKFGKAFNIEITSYYKRAVLNAVAVANRFRSANDLLMALGLDVPGDYIKSLQSDLWEEIRLETLRRGVELLEEDKPNAPAIHANTPEGQQLLDIAAQEKGGSADSHLFALGSGIRSADETKTLLGKIKARLVEMRHAAESPGQVVPHITWDVAHSETPDNHVIEVKSEYDQPDILLELTKAIWANGGHLTSESRSEVLPSGAHVHLVIPKLPALNIQKLLKDIDQLQGKLPLANPHGQKFRRFTASVRLRPEGFQRLLQQLKDDIPGHNIIWFAIDRERTNDQVWLNITLAIPMTPAIPYPDAALKRSLRKLRKQPAEMSKIEISPSRVTDATVKVLQAILNDENWMPINLMSMFDYFSSRAFWKDTPPVVSFDEHPDHDDSDQSIVDWTFVKRFSKALRFANRFHSRWDGSRRVPEMRYGGETYLSHPKRVAALRIKHGERDPVLLIAPLLHDVTENAPRNLFISEHPGERIPKMEEHDPRMLRYKDQVIEEIRDGFPEYEHRLVYTLSFVDNYMQAEELKDRGGIGMTGLKLDDGYDNLHDIWDVPPPPDKPDFTPARQIAKRIRGLLPLVAWEGALKNYTYRSTRSDFMAMIIRQSAKLSDEEFMTPFYRKHEKDNLRPVYASMIDMIDRLFAWWSKNQDIVPSPRGASEEDLRRFMPEEDPLAAQAMIFQFHTRLQKMREGLTWPLILPSDALLIDQEPRAPTLEVDSPDVSAYLTREWFQGTPLENHAWFYASDSPAKRPTPTSLEGELVFIDSNMHTHKIEEVRADLTLLADAENRLATGPILKFNPPAHRDFAAPYFPELLRSILLWLRETQQFEIVRFPILYGTGHYLMKLLDGMRADPGVQPYRLEPPDKPAFIYSSLKDLQLRHSA
jgi:hypothetical protein